MYAIVSHRWEKGFNVEEPPDSQDLDAYWEKQSNKYCSVLFQSLDEGRTWSMFKKKGIGAIDKILAEHIDLLSNHQFRYQLREVIFYTGKLGLVCSGNLVVSIKNGGQADKAGVSIGWVIRYIDGQSVDNDSVKIGKLLSDIKNKESTTILFDDTKKTMTPLVSVMDQNRNLKQGWMTKRGGIVHNWQRRYFILKPDGNLLYFKTDKCKELKAILVIRGASILNLDPIEYGKEFSIGLNSPSLPGRTYVFVADSLEEHNSWLLTLSELAGKKNFIMMKEGELYKLGNISRTWKKRYFILSSHCLQYFKDKNSMCCGEITLLYGATVVPESDDTYDRKFTFTVTPTSTNNQKTRTYVLVADSASVMNSWIHKIHTVVADNLRLVVGQSISSLKTNESSQANNAYIHTRTRVGWLKRQEGVFKNWKQRFFVLSGNVLLYFKDENDATPHGFMKGKMPLEVIQLDTAEIQEESEIEQYAFSVITKTKQKYIMLAPGTRELKGWISDLKTATDLGDSQSEVARVSNSPRAVRQSGMWSFYSPRNVKKKNDFSNQSISNRLTKSHITSSTSFTTTCTTINSATTITTTTTTTTTTTCVTTTTTTTTATITTITLVSPKSNPGDSRDSLEFENNTEDLEEIDPIAEEGRKRQWTEMHADKYVDPSSTLEGWLLKSLNRYRWATRFFILKGEELSYYCDMPKKKEATPKGILKLNGAMIEIEDSDRYQPNTFSITIETKNGKGKKYLFTAKNAEVRTLWMLAIQKTITEVESRINQTNSTSQVEGYLCMLDSKGKWKKGYFLVTADGLLEFYKSHTHQKSGPLKRISLRGSSIQLIPKDKYNRNAFSVTGVNIDSGDFEQEVWILNPETREEMDRWVKVVTSIPFESSFM